MEKYYLPESDLNIVLMNVIRRKCLTATDIALDTSKTSP